MDAILAEMFEPRVRSCETCIHFRGLTCDAYPEGIPYMITAGERPHDRPLPGDHGIMYEPDMTIARRKLGL